MVAIDGVNGTVCNAQQYQLYLSSLHNTNFSISCLTHGETIGLMLAYGTALLSLASVISIYLWIGWNVRWYMKNVPRCDWKLFRRPFDVYMSALLGFEAVCAIGGILNVRWAHSGFVTTGPYCTAQGIIYQFGILGNALITLILAVHTFVAALWQVGLKARGFSLGLVGLVCLFCALCVGICADIHNNYVTPTPFWCWISPHYPGERLGCGYIFLGLALCASVLLYVPLYFWKKGRLSVDEKKWYKLKFQTLNFRQGVASEHSQNAAWGMLFYPLAYSLVFLPFLIVRRSIFDNKQVSSAATFFVISMFNLSGAINVVSLLIIRPQLLLLARPECRVVVNVGLETEGISRTPKTPPSSSVHSEAPLRPLTDFVLDISPQPRLSLNFQSP